MTIKKLRSFICVGIVAVCAGRASAVVLFSDNFNTNTSANWTVNKAPTTNTASQQTAEFAFDYSAFGIPPAPGSTDTLGLRLRANVPPNLARPAGLTSGLSVSPTGKSFGTSYQVDFYAWSNFFGAPNVSGLADNANSAGGTNNVLFAVGTSGTVPLVVGNTTLVTNGAMDGVGFATTPDGGITNDFRVYPASGTFVPGTTAGVYAAGASATANQNTNAYYATLFPSVAAPAVQQTLATAEFDEATGFNPMAGTTQAGGFGFAWHHVVITKNGNIVTWTVDNTLLATENASTLTLGGSNIALGESDVNATTAQHPSLLFTVFDNLTVTDLPPAAQLGDFNNNGTVDAGDYDIWRKNDIANAAIPNDGGALTQPDRYTVWRSHFGAPPGAGSSLGGSAVPEPSSLMLLVFGICTCCWSARRKSC